ncbi:hypothetical protein FQR65_LT08097 [Abscondita terminalis]|nr:hypothetical protein FQR65_LT08097 [Abscondita terminalis]
MNKTCIFFLIFFVNIYANEDGEEVVILWYPYPIKVKEMQKLTRYENCPECREFLLKHWYPNYTENCTQEEEHIPFPNPPQFPNNDVISVRHRGEETEEDLNNAAIESLLRTVQGNDAFTNAGANSITFPGGIIPRSGNIELMKKIIYNDNGIPSNIYQPPTEILPDTEDITTRIDTTPEEVDYVTSKPKKKQESEIQFLVPETQEFKGNDCNCTNFLTDLIKHYFSTTNS